MQLTKNFKLQEFVPREIYERFGSKSTMFINPLIPTLAQFLRDRFNKSVTINNWSYWREGMYLYNNSGFRVPDCEDGAGLSRHKLGLCIDTKVNGVAASEVQADIKDNYKSIYKPLGLTAIELDTKTWTHLSTEWTNQDDLKLIPYY